MGNYIEYFKSQNSSRIRLSQIFNSFTIKIKIKENLGNDVIKKNTLYFRI